MYKGDQVNLQLTIKGSGKHKQTITKVLALPGGIKTYTFRNSGGDTSCADEIVTSIPTRLKPALEHFQNSN